MGVEEVCGPLNPRRSAPLPPCTVRDRRECRPSAGAWIQNTRRTRIRLEQRKIPYPLCFTNLPEIDLVWVCKTNSQTALCVIQKLSPPWDSVRAVPRRVAASILRFIQYETL